MAKGMIDLTTDIKQEARLAVDPRPRRGPFRRIQGRLVVDALGFWWPVRTLLAAGAALAAAAALWWLLR